MSQEDLEINIHKSNEKLLIIKSRDIIIENFIGKNKEDNKIISEQNLKMQVLDKLETNLNIQIKSKDDTILVLEENVKQLKDQLNNEQKSKPTSNYKQEIAKLNDKISYLNKDNLIINTLYENLKKENEIINNKLENTKEVELSNENEQNLIKEL